MKNFILMLSATLSLILNVNQASAQKVRIDLHGGMAEAPLYRDKGALYSDMVKVMFSVRALDIPHGASQASLEDISPAFPNLRRKLHELSQRFGGITLTKMFTGRTWGDTLQWNQVVKKYVTVPELSQWFQIKFSNLVPVDSVTYELKLLPEVTHAEPPLVGYSYISPNDPNFVTGDQWELTQIQAPLAWNVTKGNPNLSIGIVECGVNVFAQELSGKIIGGDGVLPSTIDHGTAIAALAAGNTDNNLGGASLGWDLKLRTYSYESQGFASAIGRAALGNPIINMSFGIFRGATMADLPQSIPCQANPRYAECACVPYDAADVRGAIEDAVSRGVICVAAVGNKSINTQAISDGKLPENCDPAQIPYSAYPASYAGVIGVSATGLNGSIEQFYSSFNYDRETTLSPQIMVDFSAPGANILVLSSTESYMRVDGTSCAAPQVAALIGLMRSLNPSLTLSQLNAVLAETADKIDGTAPGHEYVNGWNRFLGYGRINANKALQKVIADLATTSASSIPSASWNNSGRHLAVASDRLHELFISGGEIFYRRQVRSTGVWEATARISVGNGSNNHPGLYRASNGTLHAVWERSLGSSQYEIYYASSSDGLAWTAPRRIITGVTVSSTQYNTYPVISQTDAGKIVVVYCMNFGLRSATSTDGGTTWVIDTIPQGPYTMGYGSYVWYPSLTKIGSTLWLSYDYRYYGVYMRSYNGTTWSAETNVSSGTGTIQGRVSSIACDREVNAPMVAFSAQKDGEAEYRTVIRYGTSGQWFEELPKITGVNDFYPSITSSYYGVKNGWGRSVASYTGDNRVRFQDHNEVVDGRWNSQFLSTNSAYAALAEETETTSNFLASVQWTAQQGPPYQVGLWHGTVPLGKSSVPTASSYTEKRRLVLEDTAAHTVASLELSPISLISANGDTSVVPFKRHERKLPLAENPDSILALAGSESFLVPAGAERLLLSIQSYSCPEAVDSTKEQAQETKLSLLQPYTLELLDGASGSVLRSQNYSDGVSAGLPIASYQGKELTLRLRPQLASLQAFRMSVGAVYEAGTQAADKSAVLSKTPGAREIPVAFGLEDAYPNPFNPSTMIRLALPSDVQLKFAVYDVLGREVATLARGFHKAGYHSYTWNAGGAASGLYFARLEVVDALGQKAFTKTTKLLLTK